MNCKYCKADCAMRGDDNPKECRGFIPMTNADHIRSMTDGQLAAFLIRGAEEEIFFVDEAIGGSCDGWLERDELLDWLKQPYKEE